MRKFKKPLQQVKKRLITKSNLIIIVLVLIIAVLMLRISSSPQGQRITGFGISEIEEAEAESAIEAAKSFLKSVKVLVNGKDNKNKKEAL